MNERPVCGQWYDIDGYSKYAVTPEGEIGKKLKSGRHRIIRPIEKIHCNGSPYMYVHIMRDDGKMQQVKIANIVWSTFHGDKGEKVIHHINGLYQDNDLDNLQLVTRNKLGKTTGHIAKSKSVARISRDGEVICWYRSAREAAKHVNMCYQTVMDRCNRKVKNEFALDGTTFRWLDEEKKIDKFCKMLKDASVRKAGDARPEAEWEW